MAEDSTFKVYGYVYESTLIRVANLNCSTFNFTSHTDPFPGLTIFQIIHALCNIILNGFCLKIFFHSSWKSSTMSILLKALSLFEVLFAVFYLLYLIQQYIEPDVIHMSDADEANFASKNFLWPNNIIRRVMWIVYIKLVIYLSAFFQILRNWTVVLLAAYRYNAVCRPIAHSSTFAKKRIYLTLCLITVICSIGVMPRIFETSFSICSKTGRYLAENLATANKNYMIYYRCVVLLIIQNIGPLVLICILSSFVLKRISQRKEFHKKRMTPKPTIAIKLPMENSKQAQTSIRISAEKLKPSSDILVLTLCLIFFILETPSFFSKALDNYLSQKANFIFGNVANILINLDSTLNVFIYMGSNPTFRQVSRDLFNELRIKCVSCSMVRRKSNSMTDHSNVAENEIVHLSPDSRFASITP